MTREIFISYSRRDINMVKSIMSDIEHETGKKCWQDLKDINADEQDYLDKIVEGIQNCKVFFFMLSKSSQESEHAVGELTAALKQEQEKGIHVVVINIDDCDMCLKFTVRFALQNIIMWTDSSQREHLISDLKSWLKELSDEESTKIKDEIIQLTDNYNELYLQQISIVNQLIEKNLLLGNTTKQCPVCNKKVPIGVSFCDQCGWGFSSLYEMGGNFNKVYDQSQRKICLDNWMAIEEMASQKDNMQEQVRLANTKIDTLTKELHNTRQELEDTFTKLKDAQDNPKLPPFIQQIIDNLIYVEGGSFIMGATQEQEFECRDFEKPVHEVHLDSFHIGRTPVTQQQWEAIMGYNPSCFKGEKLPVEQVSWVDCHRFISKLNALTGKKFRLLTEAEWEFAARGGTKSCGSIYSGGDTYDDVAWYKDNSDSKTHPVASKSPNELGIYDMSGNVWEWCQDWDGQYPSTPVTNPKGPTSGSYRLFRGGSWCSTPRDCRVSYRNSYAPTFTSNYLGFRLAL